ncbi:MAG: hypothetical protein JEZ05_04200 [Tenericutes bacterium]|nr:hypothetical protein [Mycoplasmatota bacterium]
MDAFDNIYEEKMGKGKSLDYGNQSLLDEKREEIYKFLTSTLTLIVVIGLWISFIYGIFSSISSFGAEGGNAFSEVFTLLLNIFLGVIVPIGFYKLYNGSKKKDVEQVTSGFDWLVMNFKIMKVVLIIVSVFVGIMALIGMFMSPAILLFMVVPALIFALAFYIIAIFKDFFSQMNVSFNSGYDTVTSAKKVFNYLVVIFVITILGSLIFLLLFQNIETLIPAGFEDQFGPILANLDTIRFTFYISLAISLLSQAYLIYYVSQFEKTFTTFNMYYRKKIEEVKRNKENQTE